MPTQPRSHGLWNWPSPSTTSLLVGKEVHHSDGLIEMYWRKMGGPEPVTIEDRMGQSQRLQKITNLFRSMHVPKGDRQNINWTLDAIHVCHIR